MIRWVLVTAALAAGAVRLAAQTLPPPAMAEAGVATKRAEAVRLGRVAIRVDGRLDDGAWGSARWITDFVQKEPNEGAEPTERTAVAFLYDDAALYVAARMYSNDPSRIQAPLTRRDVGTQSEHLWISLDTYRDRRTAYSFGITAAGTRMDWYHPRDHEYDIDMRFDPVWEAEAVIDSLGWTAEMRIPFSQLRFNAGEAQVWGLNIDRWVPSRREDIFWIPVPKNEIGWSSRMGELHGIRGIAPSRRLELLPYVASNATLTRAPDPADPFDDGVNLEGRAGADLKVGLGPSLTLDATINPDFGQVEADPAVVNLSAFEVFFPERRPFFTEGSQLLESNFFYSRRIGAAPRGRGPSGDFERYPEGSTILGAAKVSGRLPSGLSLAVLGAVTGREYAEALDAASGTTRRREVAPLTGFTVVRGLQEFGRNASTVGATLTWVGRDLNAANGLDTTYTRGAIGGRVDWNLRFARGRYVFGGNLGFTRVTGEPGDSFAIARLQRSSVHYFQRPDADHVEYDPRRTTLSGHAGSVFFEKTGGRWRYDVRAFVESPEFDSNDAGRLASADGRGLSAELAYRETRPGSWFYEYQLGVEVGAEWNYRGIRQVTEVGVDGRVTWRNYWTSSLRLVTGAPSYSQWATRGGPLMGTPRFTAVIGEIENRFGARTRWNAEALYASDALGGETYSLQAGIGLRPGARLQISARPEYERSIEPRQYVTTDSGSGPAETYDGRYIFAFVDRTELSVQLRASLTITPDLSFELYAEPFTASGHYYGFGHLAAAGGTALVPYSADTTQTPSIGPDSTGSALVIRDAGGYRLAMEDPDFNVLSFRTNLVLRWEWRRGSTLYLVWQADRGAEDGRGVLVRPSDWWDAFRAPGENFLALKVSYWIPVR